uniref:Protein phosphatase 1 regulatory inhibitor subunit 14B n=1 Tax=Leptobrachium leishanense TaxID=445787 RepID=A0A8C5QWB8_9ANUR
MGKKLKTLPQRRLVDTRQADIRDSLNYRRSATVIPPSSLLPMGYDSSEEEDCPWHNGRGPDWPADTSRDKNPMSMSAAARKRAQKKRKKALAAELPEATATEPSAGGSEADTLLSDAEDVSRRTDSPQQEGDLQPQRISETPGETVSLLGAEAPPSSAGTPAAAPDDMRPTTMQDYRNFIAEIKSIWLTELSNVRSEVKEVRSQMVAVQAQNVELAEEQTVLSAQEEEIPELEIDVDELLDMETDQERGERVKELMTDCYKPTEAFISGLLEKIQGMQKLSTPQKK